MAYKIFSKRQQGLKGELPDTDQDETIPRELRVQIFYIWEKVWGEVYYNDFGHLKGSQLAMEAYSLIKDTLCEEYGVLDLGEGNDFDGEGDDSYWVVRSFFFDTKYTDKVIDVIELSFRYIDQVIRDTSPDGISPDEAIDLLNRRFHEHNVGYQYESGEIKVDSQDIQSEVVKSALMFLSDKMPHNIKIHTNTNKEIELYKASYALVIGNSNYTEWNPLPGALQDVNEVKDVLVKHGFNVTLKTDLNKSEFEKAVAQFVLESGKDKDNRLLFYYAGHGHTRKTVNGEDLGYLVMVDAPTPDRDEISFEVASIDMSSLVTQAEKIQARHVLFMFDSCFSGTIFNVRNELQLPEGISDSVKHPVRQFITAGRAGETVPDCSYFKVAFLDLIQGHVPEPFCDGYITGEELGYYLKNKVPEYIKGQHPQYGKIRHPSLDKGDFVFVLPQTRIVGKDETDTEDFVKLDMPLEKTLTRITFTVTDLSGDSNEEVVFEGEGLTRYPDRMVLTQKFEENGRTYYPYYILLPQYAVEGNGYIFVPLAQSGGGLGVFWALNVVDKKMLRSVDDVGLGDRADVKEVILADADSDTVSITYIKREVRDGEVVYDPDKAIKKHFSMIQGTLQEVETPNRVPSSSYANMVLIPAGEFEMVSNISESGEKLVRTVYIDAFYTDKYEVTNAQYKMFVDANPEWQKGNISSKYHDGNYLKSWNGNNYPSGKDNHPVVNVSWYGAMAYAKWVGKRLPTQAEWEKAARGGLVGQNYPWGNSIDSSKANYSRNVGDTTPVGNYPPNGYNLYDITGNVWEWCLDEHDRDFYLTLPRHNPIAGASSVTDMVSEFLDLDSWRVLCGGSWIRFARDIKVSDFDYGPPNFSHDDFGFRCVKPVEP